MKSSLASLARLSLADLGARYVVDLHMLIPVISVGFMTELDALITSPIRDEVSLAASSLSQQLTDRYDARVHDALSLQDRHEIPSDPASLGLGQFHQRLAYINRDSTRVATLLSELKYEKRQAQARVRKAKALLEERIHLLINHDDEIKAAEGGQKGREMAARDRASREVRILDWAEMIYTQILGYHEAASLAHDTLKQARRDNMDQLAVIREQIRLGEVQAATFPVPGNQIRQQPSGSQLQADLAQALDGKAEGTAAF
jgi:hypothetical protein